MSSVYCRKMQPDDINLSKLSKLYKNGLKTEPCDRTLYSMRVIHILHHSRLQINWKITRGSSFSSITPHNTSMRTLCSKRYIILSMKGNLCSCCSARNSKIFEISSSSLVLKAYNNVFNLLVQMAYYKIN
jgi:hypothetical protein